MPSTIGELRGIEDGLEIEWKIFDFFTLSIENYAKYQSPVFDFGGDSWYLRIDPNGSSAMKTTGEIDCYLRRSDSGIPATLKYEFGLKKLDGSIDKPCNLTKRFEKGEGYGCTSLISRSKLLARKSDLAPYNVLTILCKLKQDEPKIISSFPLQKIKKLSHDLKDLMLNGNDSDLTVRVKEKEFKLHKNILGVRAPAFASAVKKRLEENLVDTVDVDECEEAVFKMFLEFVYTGTVADLSQKNFLGLYEIAEKYEVAELKEDCLRCIKDALSTDNFFDAIILAEKYDEKELKSLTSNFCSDNLKDLVKNKKWLALMEDNTKKAYELLSTALDNYVKS